MLHVARGLSGVYGYAREDLRWVSTEKRGMEIAPVRASREEGEFLGYLAFERFADTGVHQHLGPAFSYFLQGGLADYQGVAREGEVGVNLAGATHSATAFAPTLTASRLEAPVIYPSADSVEGATLHTGARPGRIVNEAPDVMPDLNVPLEALRWQGTGFERVRRRLVFDYDGTGHDRRCVQMQMLPYSAVPRFRATAPMDVFVLGGGVRFGNEAQVAGGFFVIEEGAVCDLATEYGGLCLVWSEGPVEWIDAPHRDPFGF